MRLLYREESFLKERNMKDYIFTSESVTEGHPDKICDLIADTILDEAIRQDRYAHMAVEATIKDGFILIYGEASFKGTIDYEAIAKKVIKDIGIKEEYSVLVKVSEQSKEIDAAVTQRQDLGASDQGIMFGYACDETKELMPLPISLAHKLAQRLSDVRRESDILLPDGKTQVSVAYKDDIPVRVHTIVVSTQHIATAVLEDIKKVVMDDVIRPIVPESLIDEETTILINPSGSFINGGSFADSGTTGRKIVVDSYGGRGRVGGGCFSSKDPTKVDRSAAYYCRYVAKSIVAAGLCRRCEVGVSYAIGKAEPLAIFVDAFGTSKVSDAELLDIVGANFDFRVANIIEELDLLRPIYAKTAVYGHFGRSISPWERVKPLRY